MWSLSARGLARLRGVVTSRVRVASDVKVSRSIKLAHVQQRTTAPLRCLSSTASSKSDRESSTSSSIALPSRHAFGAFLWGMTATVAFGFLAKLLKEEQDQDQDERDWLPKVKAASPFFGGGGKGDSSKGSSRRHQYNFIADVVEEVASSLVYIEIKDLGVRDYFTGKPVTNSNGSGFVIKEDGLILTNAHVVINKPNASVQVRLQDGRTFTGVVEDVDVRSDLATVRIPCKGLPVMPLGESISVRPGEFVIALGSPLSLSNTITTGVVSTVSRAKDELGLKNRDVPDYIQTDAAITFGNSGGPLVNLDGQAIGINSMKVTPGISFAIPIDHAKEFLEKSESSKATRRLQGRRRYVGITMLTINPQVIEELRPRLEMPSSVNSGIVIFKIIAGSPADTAGLMPGDIITHINDEPVHGSKDVYTHLEGTKDLKVKVIRKGRWLEAMLKPESVDS